MYYFGQAIQGQLQILSNRTPIIQAINDQHTPGPVKSNLQHILELRAFAERVLKLPVKQQYASYADLKRDYVVWNVFAAPEFSLNAKTWCYPVVGCTSYRGYFSEAHANSYAHKLRDKGYDVYVAGIAAYSTLGWFNDPVLSTFINRDQTELADLIFHELAHHQLYVKGDTVFNESFATLVAQEGLRRWMGKQQNNTAYQQFTLARNQQTQFISLVTRHRNRLQATYDAATNDQQKRESKRQIINELKQAYVQLKKNWNGQSNYDKWFNNPINNAQLNTVATYFDHVPALKKLLQKHNHDLPRFYKACAQLAKLPFEERERYLTGLSP